MPMPSKSNKAVPIRISRAWLLLAAIVRDILEMIPKGEIEQ